MKLVKSLTIATVIIFSGLAIANPQHNQRGSKNPLMKALHKLDLSAEQKKRVKQVMQSTKSKRKILNNQLAEGKWKMAKLLDTDKQDKAAIEALATEQSLLMKQLILHRAEQFSQIRRILNEKQQIKLRKIRENRKKGKKRKNLNNG